MPSLSDLIRAANEDLPVTMRQERWLMDGSKITPEAAEFAHRALSGELGSSRKREPLFRASGMGSCKRKQVFSLLASKGHLQKRETQDGKSANVFLTGNFFHLKWQVAGLSAGWLNQCEVPVDRPERGYGGTMDGEVLDGSGFEFKSINTRGFASVTDQRQPTYQHRLQVHAYMELAGKDAFSVVYEDKNTQEWKEYRVTKDPEIEDAVLTEMAEMVRYQRERELPPMQPKCVDRVGYEYLGCPFRDVCPIMKVWPKDA